MSRTRIIYRCMVRSYCRIVTYDWRGWLYGATGIPGMSMWKAVGVGVVCSSLHSTLDALKMGGKTEHEQIKPDLSPGLWSHECERRAAVRRVPRIHRKYGRLQMQCQMASAKPTGFEKQNIHQHHICIPGTRSGTWFVYISRSTRWRIRLSSGPV